MNEMEDRNRMVKVLLELVSVVREMTKHLDMGYDYSSAFLPRPKKADVLRAKLDNISTVLEKLEAER